MRIKTGELSEYGGLDHAHPVVQRVLKIMEGVTVRCVESPDGWFNIDWNGKSDAAHQIYKEFNVEHKADYSWIAFVWLWSTLHRAGDAVRQ